MAETWVPKTKLGKMVYNGEIASLDEVFKLNKVIKEPEIVDVLLPNLESEVVDINLVQKQTDAGERTRFRVVVVVGNRKGYVGLGKGLAPEIPLAIQKAMKNAKLNIKPVLRGCGSWTCGCGGEPHSVPFATQGICGSVKVKVLPAPRGVGLVTGDKAKIIFRLAGISDVWTKTKGNPRTTINFVGAVYDALMKTMRIVTKKDWGI